MQKFYEIDGKGFPLIGQASVIDENHNQTATIPIVDCLNVSDYQWQLDCLNDRINHPERYSRFENVEEVIAELRDWLAKHIDKAGEKVCVET